MTKIIKNILLLVSLIVVLPVYAEWVGPTYVDIIYPHNDGHVYVYFADNPNPDGCTAANAKLENTHNNFDKIYAVLLTALTTGQKIQYYQSGCVSGTHRNISRVKIHR